MDISDPILVDPPADRAPPRITLNRPENCNAMSNALCTQIFATLEAADRDPDISVIILRGAGSCVSAGYDSQ